MRGALAGDAWVMGAGEGWSLPLEIFRSLEGQVEEVRCTAGRDRPRITTSNSRSESILRRCVLKPKAPFCGLIEETWAWWRYVSGTQDMAPIVVTKTPILQDRCMQRAGKYKPSQKEMESPCGTSMHVPIPYRTIVHVHGSGWRR